MLLYTRRSQRLGTTVVRCWNQKRLILRTTLSQAVWTPHRRQSLRAACGFTCAKNLEFRKRLLSSKEPLPKSSSLHTTPQKMFFSWGIEWVAVRKHVYICTASCLAMECDIKTIDRIIYWWVLWPPESCDHQRATLSCKEHAWWASTARHVVVCVCVCTWTLLSVTTFSLSRCKWMRKNIELRKKRTWGKWHEKTVQLCLMSVKCMMNGGKIA